MSTTHPHRAETGSPAVATVAQLERQFAGPGRRRRPTWERGYVKRAVALDAVAGAVAALVGAGVGVYNADADVELSPVLAVLAGPAIWVLCVALARGYEERLLGVGTDEFRSFPKAAVGLLALTAVVTFASFQAVGHLSRYFVLVFVPLSLLGSLLLRFLLRKRLHRARQHGEAMQRAIVIGQAGAVRGLVDDMRQDASHGLLPVAAATPHPASEQLDGLQRHGHVQDAVALLDELRGDVAVVAHPSEMTPHEMRRLSWALEERDVDLIVSPGIMEVAGPRLSIRPASSLSLVHVERPSIGAGEMVVKSIFDRVFAALLCLMLSPVLLGLALAVRLDSKGPVFFRQQRVGAGGEPFSMFKFRSMVVNAEDLLDEAREDADDGNGMLFKRHDDPRITRVGKVIRRYSLDELPQLFNVLLGQMSLVGPRPPLETEVDAYEAEAIRRLRVLPGMTGLWQVSGRSDLSWDDSLRLDLRYVDNWSMMLDLQIIWRTVRAVLWGEGAY